MLDELNPEKALVFRIVHRDNLPWILKNGVHCRRSAVRDPNFVPIGLKDLIDRRNQHAVSHAMGGTLSNYVPFYFTPLSMMALRIKTGRGVTQRQNKEIVILVTSLQKLHADGIPFLFTDKHAVMAGARYSKNLSNLIWIDWSILQNRDFSRDNDDLGKTDRYQAEALVHSSLPIHELVCIACYDQETKMSLERLVGSAHAGVPVIRRQGWYF